MKARSRLLILGVLACLGSSLAHAVDLEASFAPVLWSHKETMPALPAQANTPMLAKVSGAAWSLGLGFRQRMGEQWSWGVFGEALTSLRTRNEVTRWPAAVAQARFDVNHGELRGELFYHGSVLPDGMSVGLWSAWQDDVHWRSMYTPSGLLAPMVADPARESVQATWLGASARLRMRKGMDLRMDIGVPLVVKTVRDVNPGVTFSSNQGLRFRLLAGYPLYDWGHGLRTDLQAELRFRELGNEIRLGGTWPKQQWRTLSLGVRQRW